MISTPFLSKFNSKYLKRIWLSSTKTVNTTQLLLDLIIVDEAHHYSTKTLRLSYNTQYASSQARPGKPYDSPAAIFRYKVPINKAALPHPSEVSLH